MPASIILPTLNRPHKLKRVLEEISNTVNGHELVETIVIVDEGDLESLAVVMKIGISKEHEHMNLRVATCLAGSTAVDKWNIGAKMMAFKNDPFAWVMLAADDIYFPANWLEDSLSTHNHGFLAFRDFVESTKHFEPHFMATVGWLSKFNGGVLAIPHYKQWGFDVEIAERANKRGDYKVSDAIIRHPHVVFGTAPNDSTYDKGKQHYFDDIMRLNFRREQGFPDDFEGYL